MKNEKVVVAQIYSFRINICEYPSIRREICESNRKMQEILRHEKFDVPYVMRKSEMTKRERKRLQNKRSRLSSFEKNASGANVGCTPSALKVGRD